MGNSIAEVLDWLILHLVIVPTLFSLALAWSACTAAENELVLCELSVVAAEIAAAELVLEQLADELADDELAFFFSTWPLVL